MTVKPHAQTHPKAVKSSTVRRQYQRQQRYHRERFTPAQIRQIEREEALLEKARKGEERDKKRKVNKKKKEEKEAKEREERRKLVREGKLKEEDIWAKCAASQQRLNTFFGSLAGKKRKRDDSQDSRRSSEGSIASAPAEVTEALDAEELRPEQFSSSAPDTITGTVVVEEGRISPRVATKENAMDVSTATEPCRLEQTNQHQQLDPSLPGSLEFEILDDADIDTQLNGAAPSNYKQAKGTPPSESMITNASNCNAARSSPPHNPIVSPITLPAATPVKRAVFDEMTPSKVNLRASEKPDITSVAPPGSDLPSPSPERSRPRNAHVVDNSPSDAQNAAQVLAMICSQDFGDQNEAGAEEDENKENKDPWREPYNRKTENGDSKRALKRSYSTLKATSDPEVVRMNSGSSKHVSKDEEEAETDYDDIFGYEDVFSSDDDEEGEEEEEDAAHRVAVKEPGSQRQGSQKRDQFDLERSVTKGSNVSMEDESMAGCSKSIGRRAAMGGMKNTMVDAQGSPRKPRATPPKVMPTPVPSKLLASTSMSVKRHTPPTTYSPNNAIAKSAPAKNEFSSFGIDGLDEDDFQAFAKTLDDAELKGGGERKGKGKGKMVDT